MVVLGLDAAWTANHDSGVAVVVGDPGAWRCVAAAASYEALFRQTGRHGIVEAVEAIGGAPLTVASVDMPLASVPITSRRVCDTLISSAFGACGCAVHSPSAQRPGAVSTELMAAFSRAGFELAVDNVGRHRKVIEVYPHIAVMRLLGENYRVPYKISRARKYWPQATSAERRERIRGNFARILAALRERITHIPLVAPTPSAGPAELKRFEDALDGVVCAWIGTRYLERRCKAYGDATAAIWVPADLG